MDYLTGHLGDYLTDYLVLALCALHGLGKAVADAAGHGSARLTRWFPRWAGAESWRNKYKGGDPALGPRFPLSTTLLVALTDLWHAANALSGACFDAALLLIGWKDYRWVIVGAIVLRRCVFQPFYSFLRNQPR